LSPLLPRIKPNELIRIAERIGFKKDRQSGSHIIFYRESDKRRIVVPLHKGKDIKFKTLFGIIKDMGLEPEEFKRLL
jgi:predicted RNA binding protein YcfA (HicA-like mRNA interferase family)